jgi:hypothetical protein
LFGSLIFYTTRSLVLAMHLPGFWAFCDGSC